jgi:hypothetical protein
LASGEEATMREVPGARPSSPSVEERRKTKSSASGMPSRSASRRSRSGAGASDMVL